uniref:Uncharacterized protein n=1 Tax=Ditylenchus dipsaci TaxID=166011 RepID=A0A915E169_9BILA
MDGCLLAMFFIFPTERKVKENGTNFNHNTKVFYRSVARGASAEYGDEIRLSPRCGFFMKNSLVCQESE